MYAVFASILGRDIFRNHNNWADGKLHSLQKNNVNPWLSFQRIASIAQCLVGAFEGWSLLV